MTSDQKKIDALFERFKKIEFTYSGVQIPRGLGFVAKSGDCATLAAMFQLAAEEAGIKGVNIESRVTPHLVESRPVLGRDEKGNVGDKACWYFDEHHWCEWGSQKFDILFMTDKPVDVVEHVKTESHNHVPIIIFKDGNCLIINQCAHCEGFKYIEDEQGILFKSKKEAKAYIDQNKKAPLQISSLSG